MGRTAAERRATRRRKQQDRDRRRSEGQPGAEGLDHEFVRRQLIRAGTFADDEQTLEQVAAGLAVVDPGVDEDGLAACLLAALLHGLWERGWQPADIAHVVRRHTTQVARVGRARVVRGPAGRGQRRPRVRPGRGVPLSSRPRVNRGRRGEHQVHYLFSTVTTASMPSRLATAT